MQRELLTVNSERRSFEPVLFARFKPQPPGLGDRDARAVCNVNASANLDTGCRCAVVSGLLLHERFETANAALIGIVHNPARARLARRGDPASFAHAHDFDTTVFLSRFHALSTVAAAPVSAGDFQLF